MKSVESKNVWPINDGQTIIISSKKCKESLCFGMIDGKPMWGTCISLDKKFIEFECKHAGFGTDFLFDTTDNTGCVYIIPAASTTGIALCVEEIERKGKLELLLSRCKVSHWEPVKGYKNKVNKYQQNEMF